MLVLNSCDNKKWKKKRGEKHQLFGCDLYTIIIISGS